MKIFIYIYVYMEPMYFMNEKYFTFYTMVLNLFTAVENYNIFVCMYTTTENSN